MNELHHHHHHHHHYHHRHERWEMRTQRSITENDQISYGAKAYPLAYDSILVIIFPSFQCRSILSVSYLSADEFLCFTLLTTWCVQFADFKAYTSKCIVKPLNA
uniref:Uncharacterized protein n=1 Tax=Glossina austeni TaxID=7395 RepID=A0A1A9V5K6_GLOAU